MLYFAAAPAVLALLPLSETFAPPLLPVGLFVTGGRERAPLLLLLLLLLLAPPAEVALLTAPVLVLVAVLVAPAARGGRGALSASPFCAAFTVLGAALLERGERSLFALASLFPLAVVFVVVFLVLLLFLNILS